MGVTIKFLAKFCSRYTYCLLHMSLLILTAV